MGRPNTHRNAKDTHSNVKDKQVSTVNGISEWGECVSCCISRTPPLPPSPHATDVQNMVKLTICKFVLKHKLKSTKKKQLLNEKLMTIWLSMKYLKLTYVTSIQCILKHEYTSVTDLIILNVQCIFHSIVR